MKLSCRDLDVSSGLKSLLCKLSMFGWAVACGSTAAVAVAPAVDDTNVLLEPGGTDLAPLLPSGAGVRWAGRVQSRSSASPVHVRASWPGVALGVHFYGSQLSVTMQDQKLVSYTGDQWHSQWDVEIDGSAAPPAVIAPTTTDQQTLVAAQNLSLGEHTIWLRKRTEPFLGATEIFSIDVGPKGRLLLPPPLPARRLEVIGASVETGWGVQWDPAAGSCLGFKDVQQNQNRAWPQLLANSLQAELSNLSYSGKGMIYNVDTTNDKVNTIPVLYRLAQPMDFGAPWAFMAPSPQVVVIDVGGNDWEAYNKAPPADTFVSTYVAFVQEVLGHAPDAAVYLTINTITYNDKRQWLQAQFQAIAEQLHDKGHPKVAVYAWDPFYGAKACAGHPPAAVQKQMAESLAVRIKADLGW